MMFHERERERERERENHSAKFNIYQMRVCALALKCHNIPITLNLPTYLAYNYRV